MRNKKKGIISFSNEKKINLDLRTYNFEKADCYHTDFSSSIFEGLNMRAAKFKFCGFHNANLRFTNLTGANLKSCDLTNADLTGANLSSCNLEGTNFSGAIITDTIFNNSNIKKAKNLNIETIKNDVESKNDIT